jgi:hypothetical protein
MKPEYIRQPSEKIALGIAVIGLLFAMSAFVVMQSVQPTLSSISATMAEAGKLGGIGALLLIAGSGAELVLSRQRRQLIKYETDLMRIAAADRPNLADVSTGDAIVVLNWGIDADAHLRANYSMMRGRLGGPLLVIILACISAWLSGMYFIVLRHQPALNHIFSIYFTAGSLGLLAVYLAFLAFLVNSATKKLVRQQYAQTAQQNYALTLNPDGLNLIAGSIVSIVPWAMMRSITATEDVIFINTIPWQQIIPSYAFHSAGDAKAFAATAQALKRRKPVPAHDWSRYTNAIETTGGVWPPPIT